MAAGQSILRVDTQKVRPTSKRKSGETHWAVWRRNPDGSEPRYYLSTLPKTRLWILWPAWADPGGGLKRSSRPRRATWRWTNTRPGAGLAGIITSHYACWEERSLLSLQQAWGKRCHGSPGRRCIGWCVRCCPGSGSDLGSCCSGWRIHNVATNAPASPMPSAALTFAYPQASLLEPSLLYYADVTAVVAKVKESTADPSTKLCLEFLVLTAVRSGEARGPGGARSTGRSGHGPSRRNG